MTRPSPPATHVFDVLVAERLRGFTGLAGTQVTATLPVHQAALDTVLGRAAWPAPLEALGVEIGDANRLHVSAAVRVLGFRTQVRLQLRLAPSMEDGIVRASLDDGSLMASAVALLGPLLGRLPDGVALRGRQITVDVRRLAAQQGFEDVAGMVSAATFDSSPGVLWVTVRAAAPAPQPIESTPSVANSAPARKPFAVDPAQLHAWLQGATVDVDVHLAEHLANALLAAVHADAQVPSGDALRDTLIRAVQQPRVRFEAGVLRVSARAALGDDGASDS